MEEIIDKKVIELIDVKKHFKTKNQEVKVYDGINFDVKNNEFVTIVGPSGCGKSTLLRIISGLIKPTSGKVLVNNMSPQKYRENNKFGFVFQEPVLFPWRTSLNNVKLPLEILKEGTKEERIHRAEKALEMVQLLEAKDAYPAQLSGGMKQRVSIARSLVYEPSILLMDEPFGALDEMTRQSLNLELLRVWSSIEATIVFVTHNLSEALFLSNRIIMLTQTPATIETIFEVDLPKPENRDFDIINTMEYQEQMKIIKRKWGI